MNDETRDVLMAMVARLDKYITTETREIETYERYESMWKSPGDKETARNCRWLHFGERQGLTWARDLIAELLSPSQILLADMYSATDVAHVPWPLDEV